MVAHQAVGLELEVVVEFLVPYTGAVARYRWGQVTLEEAQEEQEVLVVQKDALLAGTAGKHMVVAVWGINLEYVPAGHSLTIPDHDYVYRKDSPPRFCNLLYNV